MEESLSLKSDKSTDEPVLFVMPPVPVEPERFIPRAFDPCT